MLSIARRNALGTREPQKTSRSRYNVSAMNNRHLETGRRLKSKMFCPWSLCKLFIKTVLMALYTDTLQIIYNELQYTLETQSVIYAKSDVIFYIGFDIHTILPNI